MKWVLMSMGQLYVRCLDNEDTILMLMKKLPDEGGTIGPEVKQDSTNQQIII